MEGQEFDYGEYADREYNDPEFLDALFEYLNVHETEAREAIVDLAWHEDDEEGVEAFGSKAGELAALYVLGAQHALTVIEERFQYLTDDQLVSIREELSIHSEDDED